LKILIIKPSSLGDVVQALPVLRLLKSRFPESEIHWWIAAELQPLLEEDQDLAGIIPFERRGWGRPGFWLRLWRRIRAIREARFDLVLDLQGLARSGMVAWLARGNLLVGLDSFREGAAGFYDWRVARPSFHTHAVDWYLEVLRRLEVPIHWNFEWLPERAEIRAGLAIPDLAPDARLILLSPGARWPNKRWPTEYFETLVRQLAAENESWQFGVLGSAEDRELGNRLAAAAPGRCLDLTGRTALPELVEWIRAADCLVTNDTGPMHIAAALRVPVLALFGPTEPRRTGPYGQLENVLQLSLPCVPCLKASCHYERPIECLRAIQPARVLARARQMLAAPAA